MDEVKLILAVHHLGSALHMYNYSAFYSCLFSSRFCVQGSGSLRRSTNVACSVAPKTVMVVQGDQLFDREIFDVDPLTEFLFRSVKRSCIFQATVISDHLCKSHT
jgi:hypothetical protein